MKHQTNVNVSNKAGENVNLAKKFLNVKKRKINYVKYDLISLTASKIFIKTNEQQVILNVSRILVRFKV